MTKMENPIVLSDWPTIGQLDLRKVNGKVNQPCAFGGRLITIFLFFVNGELWNYLML